MPRQMKKSGIEWIGMIPAKWKVSKNKYLISSLYSGGTPSSTDDSFYSDDGIPFVSIGDMSSVDYVYDTKKKVSLAGLENKNLRVLTEGTIIYSIYATIGAISELKIPATISQAMLALTIDNSMHSTYYKYNLRAMRDYIFFEANGNTQFNLNAEKVKNFWFVVPSLEEQRRIAEYLDLRCMHIDSVLEQTRNSIEDYKKLRQAVITQAVTKGIRGDRHMKDSNVEWLGDIPKDWTVYRIANLYDERSENGLEELPILTVSINTGVSDHEIADEDKDRVFVRSEDRTKYKRVYPGDLAYNMMRAWQGAFGAVRVDGMVSPAYVVAKPKKNVELDSRYMEALLRTSEATEEMHRYSRGIVDFRLRLYWPEFKNIRICLPPIAEQVEIADYIDEKSAAIDALIAKKEAFAEELENYKKSMIYEYVTGKKEVSQS